MQMLSESRIDRRFLNVGSAVRSAQGVGCARCEVSEDGVKLGLESFHTCVIG
jgi:hypothetical protein